MFAVRELGKKDIGDIIDYWFNSDPEYLRSLGVDLTKLPSKAQMEEALSKQVDTPIAEKTAYCLTWWVDGRSIGHCNTNPVVFGEEAFMHLHIWHQTHRQKGYGEKLVRLSIPYFFHQLQLKRLFSQPHANNNAANKTLQNAGFELKEELTTTPGSINFLQPVKRWLLSADKFREIYGS